MAAKFGIQKRFSSCLTPLHVCSFPVFSFAQSTFFGHWRTKTQNETFQSCFFPADKSKFNVSNEITRKYHPLKAFQPWVSRSKRETFYFSHVAIFLHHHFQGNTQMASSFKIIIFTLRKLSAQFPFTFPENASRVRLFILTKTSKKCLKKSSHQHRRQKCDATLFFSDLTADTATSE